MEQAFAHSIVAALPLPALLISDNEKILSANAAAEAILGDAVYGRHFITVLRQPAVLDRIEACLRDHTPQSANYLTTEGAQDVTYRMTCGFVTGPLQAILVTFEDVTHLEQAGQMRRDFVANVSHELRTPLTALMGFIETLRGPARSDEAARDRFLGIMHNEASRMNRLVKDLLSLSKVETEERMRPSDVVEINGLVRGTVKTLSPVTDAANVVIQCNLPDAPSDVIGDADQLRQVLTNLIENAIKYGGSDKTVIVSVASYENDQALRGPSVHLNVQDQGPGIEDIHLPRLTERFYRIDDHRSREMGGTGLGLAIVKHIINRHRGRLRVDSIVGQGSTFTVVLPRSV